MVGRGVPYIFFVIIYYLLLRCNCSTKRTFRSTYKPYGLRMCKELCDDSEYSFLYLVEEVSCHRIKVNHLPNTTNQSTKHLLGLINEDKLRIKITSLTAGTGWDICEKEPKETNKGRLARLQHNHDATLHSACEEGEMGVVMFILSHDIADIDCRDANERTPVMTAAYHGQLEVFDFLARQGCNMNAVGKGGNNILHIACKGGNVDMVKYILTHNIISIDSKGLHQYTPVMLAAMHGNRKVVELLVTNGCNLRAITSGGCNVLHKGCHGGDVAIVKYILEQNVFSIDNKGWHGQTPVMVAAKHGHVDVVEFLVTNGCNLRATTDSGSNILHVACFGGNVAIVKYILEQNLVSIDSKRWDQQTPVMMAARRGHKEVFEFLVANGCNLRAAGKRGDNMLHAACQGGNVAVVRYIVEHTIIRLDSKGWHHQTPVMMAAKHGHMEVFEFLVAKGCNLNAVDKDGNNILHFACIGGNVGMVKYILKQNIDIDRKGSHHETPVTKAANNGHTQLVAFLVDKGCDLTAVDTDGNTILHLACEKGQIDLVTFLLKQRSVIGMEKIKNVQGRTPKKVAKHEKHIDIVALLKRKSLTSNKVL